MATADTRAALVGAAADEVTGGLVGELVVVPPFQLIPLSTVDGGSSTFVVVVAPGDMECVGERGGASTW